MASVKRLHGWVVGQLQAAYHPCVTGRKGKKGSEEITAGDFPKLVETVNLQIKEVKSTPVEETWRNFVMQNQKMMNRFRRRMILCFSLEAAQAREHRETACTERGDRTKWPTGALCSLWRKMGFPTHPEGEESGLSVMGCFCLLGSLQQRVVKEAQGARDTKVWDGLTPG